MNQSQAWLVQAASDLITAQAVMRDNDPHTYCQALAKYQQVVEKSAKAIIAAVREAGVPFNPITSDHDPSRQIRVLVTSRRALGQKKLDWVKRIFPNKRIDQVQRICAFAPRFPAPGQPFARNTEYPFEDGQGGWTAPAAPGAFALQEVRDAHQLAWLIKNQADRFAEALRLRL